VCAASCLVGKQSFPPRQFPPWIFPLPCSVGVIVRSGASKVRVRVGSVKLGLRSVGFVLVLELGLGLWFGLGGNVRGGMSRGKCPTLV